MSRNTRASRKTCCFCGLSDNNEFKYGKFYKHDGIDTHYYCLLLSSNMEQRGKDNQGILGFLIADIKKEINRGKKLSCIHCKKKGATLGCCNIKCKAIFHYPCGLRAGSLNQFFGEFRSYCMKHRPEQKIDIQACELTESKKATCCICYEQVNLHNTVNTIWAPCCKKNAWFHRKCVQQLAMSAGYFFKCPLCNDKIIFQKAMLEFGIFIPSQDASWELVPNAFQELLYRHDKCDAPTCLCPKGRNHTSFNAKWELVLCRICGSQGIHMACGQLKWANPAWECTECISILGKTEEIPSASTTRIIPENDSESEDVDVDTIDEKDTAISFKPNSPITASITRMPIFEPRPGPRTFKLKQLEALRELQKRLNSNHQDSENSNNTFYSTTEEHNLQPTSSTKSIINKSENSLTDKMLNDPEDGFNSSTEYSKQQLDEAADNVIMYSTDDNDLKIFNCRDSTVISNDNKTNRNDIFQTKNNVIEPMNQTSMLHESTALKIEKLIEKNNFDEIDTSCTFLNNLDETETESIKLQQETDFTCTDSILNIKIINIMSLAPEEFENVPSTEHEQKIDDIDNLISKNNNELLSSNTVLQSSFSQNSNLKSNSKRKPDESIWNITTKKIKKEDTVLDEASESSQSNESVQTPNISRNNSISINNYNLQNIDSHIQTEQICNTDENVLHTTNTKYSLKLNKSNNALRRKSNTFANSTNYEEKHRENTSIANEMNNIDNAESCDGDAGITHISSENTGFSETRIDSPEKFTEAEKAKSKKSEMPKEQKCQNEFVIPQNKTSNSKSKNNCHKETDEENKCSYSRLMPEYISLRDLKFRVHNLNNLQMILYDKYFVNINMENAATISNTKSDILIKKATQENKISANMRSENVCQNVSSVCSKDKNKCMFVKEQSENYQDDTKENLDPIITPSKAVTDNLLTSTTLIMNNSNVSTNCNSQSEDENLIQPVSETFEEKIIVPSDEDINLMNNIESSVATTSYNDKYSNGVNINRNIQNFHSDHVTNSAIEMHSIKIGLKNESTNNAAKLVRRTLFFENRTIPKPKVKSNTVTEADLKISIELKKIKTFINNNPDLFPKYPIGDNEPFFEKADILKERNDIEEFHLSDDISSGAQELKNLQNFTLTSRKNIIAELKSQNNENNLTQQRRYNYSPNSKKCDLKCTCSHFKK